MSESDVKRDVTFFVRLGSFTIKDGEAAVIWNKRGDSKVVVGPKRSLLWSSTVQIMSRFKAESQQYLQVKCHNGVVEHLPGPVSMYLNPILHDSINIKDGLILASEDDCIVVTSLAPPRHYSGHHHVPDDKVETFGGRRVVYGPTLYFPSPEEIIHKFQWNGLFHDNLPATITFNVLSMSVPRVWHFHLLFKTADHHAVPVQLAITFKVDSVEKCVAVPSPINVAEPALRHDVHRFKHNEIDMMEFVGNESTYPNFCEAMTELGLRVLKIQVKQMDPSFHFKQKLMTEKRLMQRLSKIDQDTKALEECNASKMKYYRGLRDIGVNVTSVLMASSGEDPLGESKALKSTPNRFPSRNEDKRYAFADHVV